MCVRVCGSPVPTPCPVTVPQPSPIPATGRWLQQSAKGQAVSRPACLTRATAPYTHGLSPAYPYPHPHASSTHTTRTCSTIRAAAAASGVPPRRSLPRASDTSCRNSSGAEKDCVCGGGGRRRRKGRSRRGRDEQVPVELMPRCWRPWRAGGCVAGGVVPAAAAAPPPAPRYGPHGRLSAASRPQAPTPISAPPPLRVHVGGSLTMAGIIRLARPYTPPAIPPIALGLV